ncbi:hypothetical protein KC19_7G028300 [Ceratodon purpureus]|uniref:Uncharacterized protein n=1 Tax=Ceratodon purpureus TaxID=3225 RepID=A0A8T0H5D1_CERPU|nr:hypothetical protein KC19_7G028300 [Ceratodon purpureus]
MIRELLRLAWRVRHLFASCLCDVRTDCEACSAWVVNGLGGLREKGDGGKV